MKLLFVSSEVQQLDILKQSCNSDVRMKNTNTLSNDDIPIETTNIAFMYHTRNRFPFYIKHDICMNTINEYYSFIHKDSSYFHSMITLFDALEERKTKAFENSLEL